MGMRLKKKINEFQEGRRNPLWGSVLFQKDILELLGVQDSPKMQKHCCLHRNRRKYVKLHKRLHKTTKYVKRT